MEDPSVLNNTLIVANIVTIAQLVIKNVAGSGIADIIGGQNLSNEILGLAIITSLNNKIQAKG